MPGFFTTFTNCRLCIGGKIIEGERLVISVDSGLILESTGFIGGEIVDLDDAIIAPGFLDLHTSGANGFQFTQLGDGVGAEDAYAAKVKDMANFYATKGVTGFWATVPTVSANQYHKILPALTPRTFDEDGGASLLGVHVEGPYLQPAAASEKHTQNSELFQPIRSSLSSVYGPSFSTVKLMTLAPELAESELLIPSLVSTGVQVTLGHSTATYEQGMDGVKAGARCVNTPVLRQGDPGLTGLIALPPSQHLTPPYYTVVANGQAVHPSMVTVLYRAAPERCILVSGPSGGEVPIRKAEGGAATTTGDADSLPIESGTVSNGVQNLIKWSGCSVAEAVTCVSENVADLMDLKDVGKLEKGRRADFLVLDDHGQVLETWKSARQVWRAEGREAPY